MSKVIQVRNVPDEVHAALVEAAARAGKSLTELVNDELFAAAKRLDAFEHNRRVIEQLRAEIGVIRVPRDEIRRIIDEGREERTQRLVERHGRRSA